ncbi:MULTISPECIES: hypothetical protein [unclassified Novosphingobium]|uniref:hypothetical protein n=1 Tax=unclassified Novosphingobium TaxID=2644732 RepID=UPI000D320DFD|nr:MULTISPECIES: hypothetical protein [unclassified Novosphingobium]
MSHVECARRRREIAQALRGSEPRKAIAARFSVSYDLIWRVARDYGLPMATSGRRPASWPDIPDHLRKDYRRLCQYMAPEAARAKLEGSAHVG